MQTKHAHKVCYNIRRFTNRIYALSTSGVLPIRYTRHVPRAANFDLEKAKRKKRKVKKRKEKIRKVQA